NERFPRLLIRRQVDQIVKDHADHDFTGINTFAAKETANGYWSECLKEIVEATRIARARHSAFAGSMETLSQQPQAAVWLGLLKTKRAPSFSRTKSISVPIRNRIAF